MTDFIAEIPLARHMNIELIKTTPDEVIGKLHVRTSLCTVANIVHGGALMSFADTLGAIGAYLNLTRGLRTTTLESKTNFLARAELGSVLTAHSVKVSSGKRTSLWQTRIHDRADRLVALVTQTQLSIEYARD